MSILRQHITGAARGDESAMRQSLDIMDRTLDGLGNVGLFFADNPSQASTAQSPPLPADFDVEGIDGKFLITIVNPQDILPQSAQIQRLQALAGMNPQLATIYHELQSATTLNFDQAAGLREDGSGPQLAYEIQDPNAQRYWRLRSSYDQSTWNDWQVFQDVTICGPALVNAGFERSTSIAPRSPLNKSNDATVDSVDSGGGTANIRIYGTGGVGSAWNRFDGQGNTLSTPAGTITLAVFTTFYNVVWDPVNGFQAFPNATQYTKSLLDAYYFVALMKTCAGGGAGGATGGGGATEGGGAGGGGGIVPDLG